MAYQGSLASGTRGVPAPVPRQCDNRRIPPLVAARPFTASRVYGSCARRGVFGVADPAAVISRAVARAAEMLDNTIGELVRARDGVCAGQPPAWPLLSDTTAHWLRNRLSVCIDDIRAWTSGTFVNRSVAEVIRRLTRVRNLIASNVITYVCNGPLCAAGDWAYVLIDPTCARTEPTVIRLCRSFWEPARGVDAAVHAEFQAQTIVHEASHLYHCTSDRRGSTIGVAECLAQFVAETNGGPVDPDFAARCPATDRCGGAGAVGGPGIAGLSPVGTGSLRILRTVFHPDKAGRPGSRGAPARRGAPGR